MIRTTIAAGVLPLQLKGADSAQTLGLKGDEEIDISGLASIQPQQDMTLAIRRADGTHQEVVVRCRIDTPIEVDYYRHGGILPFVLRGLISSAGPAKAKAA